MPIVTTDVLAFAAAGLKTDFMEAYLQTQKKYLWPEIATEIPTTLPTQNYGWLGRGATMQEYKDRQVQQEISPKTYTVTDKTYWGLMDVERRAIEDDQYGALMLRVAQLGEEPNRHWEQLLFQALGGGFSTLCSDGQYFFDTDHLDGLSGTQSNTTSSSLSDDALQTAEAAMMAFLDDKGIPMGIVPDLLVVGPKNSRKASDLTGSGVVVKNVGDGTASTGATAYTPYMNYWKGRLRVVVSPYITGFNWFMLDTSRVVKPLFMQSRSDVPISFETDMDTPQARIKEMYEFGARGRYGVGYGLWQCAYGSSASS